MDETCRVSVRHAFVQSRQAKGPRNKEEDTYTPEANPSTQEQQDPWESLDLESGFIPEIPGDSWSDSWFAEDNMEPYDADSEEDNPRDSGKEVQQKGDTQKKNQTQRRRAS
jgi:hypothetical protein